MQGEATFHYFNAENRQKKLYVQAILFLPVMTHCVTCVGKTHRLLSENETVYSAVYQSVWHS